LRVGAPTGSASRCRRSVFAGTALARGVHRQMGGRASRANQSNDQRRSTMIRRLAAFTIAAALLVLAGCNTMHGLGQDIERGGEKLQGAADKAKK
jgi:predicted small secreted protein